MQIDLSVIVVSMLIVLLSTLERMRHVEIISVIKDTSKTNVNDG